MSLGRQFIQAVIRDSTPTLLRQSGVGLFLEEELALYQFVEMHYLAHHALPDSSVLSGAGFHLPALTSSQPVSYFLTRLRQRFIYNTVAGKLTTLTTALASKDTEAMFDLLRGTLSEIGSAAHSHSVVLIGDEMDGVLDDFEIARTHFGLRGITMGWPTLDAATLGASGGDLIVIAGRPGLGKSYALQEMAYAAWLNSHRLLFLSMEMGKRQMSIRWLGRHTRLNPKLIRSGQLSPWGRQMLHEGVAQIKGATGRMYLESGQDTRKVSQLEALVLQYGPEALYVDAAYLMSSEGKKKGYVSRWESLAEVIGELKALAIRFNIPIFITVQFNRNQKNRSMRGEPDLSDIAGTDSIPQDASIVLGIQKPPAPHADNRRIMTMMKNREGDLCRFLYRYEFQPVNFEELPWEAIEPDEETEAEEAGTAWQQ